MVDSVARRQQTIYELANKRGKNGNVEETEVCGVQAQHNQRSPT